MLALAALLGVLSVCRVQVRIHHYSVSLFFSLSLSLSLSLTYIFVLLFFWYKSELELDILVTERGRASSRDAFTLEPGKCQAQQGALTAIDVVPRTPAFSFAPKSTCRYFGRDSRPTLPWRLSNGPINDRDADCTCSYTTFQNFLSKKNFIRNI